MCRFPPGLGRTLLRRASMAAGERSRWRRPIFESLGERIACDAATASLATEFIYDLNRVRYDPPAYAIHAARPAEWTEIPQQPPLAVSSQLTAAAEAHAAAMASGNFLSHHDPITGTTPHQRVRMAGYDLPAKLDDQGNAVELIAAGDGLENPDSVLRELLDDLSDPTRSRRHHLLGNGAAAEESLSGASEIGVARSVAAASSLENFWAIEIARQHAADRFLTGVVFDDADGNGRFDAGEGIGGITITSGSLTTTTDATGAYCLPASGGVHRLRATGEGLPTEMEQLVRLDDQNVQVDFPVGGDPEVNFRSRSLWTHPTRHLDVNGNGVIQPLDVLLMINRLNRDAETALPKVPESDPAVFYDTDGDGDLSPIDVLLVVNHLNRRPPP